MNKPTKDTGKVPAAPRFERRGRFVLAGLRDQFSEKEISQIPALWGKFAPMIGCVPGEVAGVAYGVCVRPCDEGKSVEYMAAVEVRGGAAEAEGFQCLEIPALEYAVFVHEGHVSTLVATLEGIQRHWAPRLKRALRGDEQDVPAFFERYGPRFDPVRGENDMEVWVPIGR